MSDDQIASTNPTQVLVCSCDETMEIDASVLATSLKDLRGTDDALPIFRQLCRSQMSGFEAALDTGAPVMVACTQEAPLFAEVAAERGAVEPTFTNIRERAGWCKAKSGATAKMAALLADATYENTPAELMTLTSDGVCLIYGAGQAAIDAAAKLAGRLSATVLLSDPDDAMPVGSADTPVYTGRIAKAAGTLGNFEVVVDGYAPVVPSSKDTLEFMMARDGAASKCDIIIDMSGGTPLFAEADRHDGYFYVDPSKPGALSDALFDASDLVGEFEKPLYVRYDAGICAHGRSKQVGCSNCIDACPVSAISPAGDIVEIDHAVCGGCGNCSASCPTGAVSYAFPARNDLVTRTQGLLATYSKAGGTNPVMLFHDAGHGAPLIAAMARYGRGLPINVLPLSVYTSTHIGHDLMASALASGAEHAVVLASNTRRDELATLQREVDLTNDILSALGASAPRVHLVVEDDPDAVADVLYNLAPVDGVVSATFTASPQKREMTRLALTQLHAGTPDAPEIIALPENAPYGRININTDGCTLCLACVSACPANALADNPDRPQVAFTEAACVQCGLCSKTCPESVITLEPRYNFSPSTLSPTVLNEEEPFNCIKCDRPFGTKSSVEHVMAALSGKHAMFASSDQAKIIQMCDDCRVIAMNEAPNPMAAAERPRVRTTEDYLMEANGPTDTDDADS